MENLQQPPSTFVAQPMGVSAIPVSSTMNDIAQAVTDTAGAVDFAMQAAAGISEANALQDPEKVAAELIAAKARISQLESDYVPLFAFIKRHFPSL